MLQEPDDLLAETCHFDDAVVALINDQYVAIWQLDGKDRGIQRTACANECHTARRSYQPGSRR